MITRGMMAGVLFILATSPLPTAQPLFARAYVAVLDDQGLPISDLVSQDFVVRVDGVNRQVVGARPASDPPNIVIIVDGYIDFYTIEMRRALQSVVSTIRRAAPEAQVGFMMSEGPAPPVLKHVSRDADGLDQQVRMYHQRGTSAPMLECIAVAARVLAEGGPRRLILLLTSQRDTVANSDRAEVIGDAVRRSGASLWALQSSLPLGQAGVVENEKVLQTLTRASGGRREQRLTWIIEEHAVALTRQMLSQYEVIFDLSTLSGPRYLRVGVGRPGVEVFAPGWIVSR